MAQKNFKSTPGHFSILPIAAIIILITVFGYWMFIDPHCFDSIGGTRGMSYSEDLQYQLGGGK